MRNIARTRQAKREPESGPGGQIDRPPPQPPPTPRTYPPDTHPRGASGTTSSTTDDSALPVGATLGIALSCHEAKRRQAELSPQCDTRKNKSPHRGIPSTAQHSPATTTRRTPPKAPDRERPPRHRDPRPDCSTKSATETVHTNRPHRECLL